MSPQSVLPLSRRRCGSRSGCCLRRHRRCRRQQRCCWCRRPSILDRGRRRVRWRRLKVRASAHLQTVPDCSATTTTLNPRRARAAVVAVWPRGARGPWRPLSIQSSRAMQSSLPSSLSPWLLSSPATWQQRAGLAWPSPSVVVFADIVGGGGGTVPAAERAPLNIALSHPDPLRRPSGISPSLSFRPRLPCYLPLPPPNLFDC